MNKKILKSVLIVAILLVCIMINNTVFAAGKFTVSKSSATVTVGKSTTFSINGTSATGRVDITSSNSSVATVSASNVWLENSSSTITITGKKVGTSTITVTGTVADSEGEEATITKTIKVTVKEKTTSSNKNTSTNNDTTKNTTTTKNENTTKTKSNNAYLSTLGVTPKEYDFSGFSKTKTSYSVTVPSDVDSLKVAYKTADSNATVKVSGNSGFEVGSDNAIKVVVTAEDGKTSKTYTIKVTKLAEEEEKPGNLLETDDLYLTSLELEGIQLSPEFAKDTYSYTATLESADVTEINVKAESNNTKAQIDISGNTELVEGENIINIVVKLDDSSVQTVYQVVLTKEGTTTDIENISAEETTSSTNDFVGTIKTYIKIIIAVIILIILTIVVLVFLLKRENKRLKGEVINSKDDKNEDEYNVYDNDLNEFEINNNNENLIETLYNKKNESSYNEEELSESDKETLEEINKQTEEIFREKVRGQSVEYNNSDLYEENPLDERRKRRTRGKHSK